MSEVVFPNTPESPGVLPFNELGRIEERDDSLVTDCKVSIFASSESPQPVGQQASFQGFADRRAAVCVGKQNLVMVIQGVKYRIIGATYHRFAGYVELDLRLVRPNG